MTALDQKTLAKARKLVCKDFGNLSDLPQEIQNTIANIYYEFSLMKLEFSHSFAFPSTIAPGKNLGEESAVLVKDAPWLMSCVRTLPDAVATIREARTTQSPAYYKVCIRFFLDTYKLKMDRLAKKSEARIALERPFQEALVKEIPDLWRMFPPV